MTEDNAPDPTEHSRWRPLRLLQAAMDADIARLYAEARIDGLKPSFVMELLRLHAKGPMTITELAGSVQLTHSAVSQKVAAMRAVGLVRTTAGADARSKKVTLTARARRIAGRLAAEWRATEAAVAEEVGEELVEQAAAAEAARHPLFGEIELAEVLRFLRPVRTKPDSGGDCRSPVALAKMLDGHFNPLSLGQ